MQIAVIMAVAAIMAACASTAQGNGLRHLRLPPPRGARAAVVHRALVWNGRDLCWAWQGQKLSARIVSPERNAVFQINGPRGRALTCAADRQDAMYWQGRLLHTGTYAGVVGGTCANVGQVLSMSRVAYADTRTSTAIRIKSPDGMLRAVVVSLVPRDGGDAESVVQIQTVQGRPLVMRDYSSSDGSHGHRVLRARWTPDGAFFVFSLASSGGHSPWHSPTHFFSRKRRRFYGLDDFIRGRSVTSPLFRLHAPAMVGVLNRDNIRVWVDLHRLERRLTQVSARSEYDNY